MKKVMIFLLTLALVAVLPLSALAATGINRYEQIVLDKIATCALVDDTGKVIAVPQEYINAARNYFLGDFEMTEEQMNIVLQKIDESVAVVQKDAEKQKIEGDSFKLSDMDPSVRDQVLSLGQQAAAQVQLNMSYNAQDKQVTISSSANNSTVFTTGGVIKTTGEDFPITAGVLLAGIATVLVLGTAVIFGVSKKAGLLVK